LLSGWTLGDSNS